MTKSLKYCEYFSCNNTFNKTTTVGTIYERLTSFDPHNTNIILLYVSLFVINPVSANQNPRECLNYTVRYTVFDHNELLTSQKSQTVSLRFSGTASGRLSFTGSTRLTRHPSEIISPPEPHSKLSRPW